MIAAATFLLCAITSLSCFVLLLRGFMRTRVNLLFWSSVGFFFFAAQNAVLFTDLVLVPSVDLSPWRLILGFIGALAMLLALIWETK